MATGVPYRRRINAARRCRNYSPGRSLLRARYRTEEG